MAISQVWEEEQVEMGKDQGPKQSFLILEFGNKLKNNGVV